MSQIEYPHLDGNMKPLDLFNEILKNMIYMDDELLWKYLSIFELDYLSFYCITHDEIVIP